MQGGANKTFFVQLVRGNNYGANDFVLSDGGTTVTDRATGLMWDRADSGSGMTWQAALAWVQAKNAAAWLGHRDWRLPNAKELQSIVDYRHAPDFDGQPALDTAFFRCTSITNEHNQADYPWFWSSTTHATYNGSGASAAYICFGRALGYMNGAWVDIHGAGCQRSDSKVDNLATAARKQDNGYYSPLAPQGDAVRVYNFVRLVRDAQ